MTLISTRPGLAPLGDDPAIRVLRGMRRGHVLTSAAVAASAATAVLVILLGLGSAGRVAAACGAGVLAVLLACRLLLRCELRLARLTLVAAGDERLALPGLADLRVQLLSARWRRQLAATIEVQARQAPCWRTLHPVVRTPGSLRTIGAAAADLECLANLLRAAEPREARAVAACELLLIDGAGSPLYANDAAALRQELSRISDQLASAW
jgi:hypothetical protein